MQCEITFWGPLGDLLGVRRRIVSLNEDIRLRELVENLAGEHGEAFRRELNRTEGMRVFINGREYWASDAMGIRLQEGDQVVMLPPISGG